MKNVIYIENEGKEVISMQKIIVTLIPILLSAALFITMGVGRSITSNLSISGTTATCSVSVRPEKNTDKVEISVLLTSDSEIVAEWSGQTSVGTLRFSEDAEVKSGKTYTMHTTCKINGVSYTIADVVKKCK